MAMADLRADSLLVTLTLLANLGTPLANPRGLTATCEAPSVYVGGTGRVTCHFNTDVTELPLPLSISVELYPDQQNGSEMAAECNWLRSGDKRCRVKRRGGRFLVTKSGDMLLEIPRVTAEHQGRYVCQLVSRLRLDSTPEPCFLFVNEIIDVRPPPHSGHDDGVWTNDTDDEKQFGSVASDWQSAADSGSMLLTIVLPSVLVPLALVLVLLALAIFIARRRGRCGGRSQQSTEDGDAEDPRQADPGEEPDVETRSPQSTLTPESVPMLPPRSDTDSSGSSVQGLGDESDHREGDETRDPNVSQFTKEIKMRAAGKQVGVHEMMRNKAPPFDATNV